MDDIGNQSPDFWDDFGEWDVRDGDLQDGEPGCWDGPHDGLGDWQGDGGDAS